MSALIVIPAVLLLLAVLFVLSVLPGRRRGGFPFEGAMIAHRGLHGGDIPENSLAAFRAAAARGGLGAELDVQLTKDQKLVVFHDGNLKRMCGADREITDCTWEELQQYGLAGTGHRIPLFQDVLQALQGIPLVCEIKVSNGADYKKLCADTYALLKDYPGPYCMESFHPGAVKWFKDHHPEVLRGQLSKNFMRDRELQRPWYQKFILTHLMANFITRPDFIAYRYQDTNVLGFRICTRWFHPHTAAWTPRGEEAIARARALGFETLIFEEVHHD